MPNRALVMSGGGSKGAFQVGALDYLINDRGLDFKVIAGVSTGSLNAVILAQGAGLEGLRAQVQTLKKIWFDIRSYKDIYKHRFLGKYLVLFAKDSMHASDPLKERLKRSVDPARLTSSGRELRVGAVCFESGVYQTVSQRDPQIREWTLASSSMPILFPPVQVGGETAFDGGVRNVTPFEDAFKALKSLGPPDPSDPDEMYVLLASPLEIDTARGPWKNGLDIAKRTVGMLVNEVYREDLEYALAVNDSVHFYEEMARKLESLMGADAARRYLDGLEREAQVHFPFKPPAFRYVKLHVVVPAREYSESLQFERERIRAAFDGGREAAHAPLKEAELRSRLGAGAPRRG